MTTRTDDKHWKTFSIRFTAIIHQMFKGNINRRKLGKVEILKQRKSTLFRSTLRGRLYKNLKMFLKDGSGNTSNI